METTTGFTPRVNWRTLASINLISEESEHLIYIAFCCTATLLLVSIYRLHIWTRCKTFLGVCNESQSPESAALKSFATNDTRSASRVIEIRFQTDYSLNWQLHGLFVLFRLITNIVYSSCILPVAYSRFQRSLLRGSH